jgi:hypothetical protein
MSAEVVPYALDPWDTENTLKVECRKCSIEWGWSWDRKGANERLQGLADDHNKEMHA